MTVTTEINLSGFQPCDVRGSYGTDYRAEISPAHAFLIGRAIAEMVSGGQRVMIAGDGRRSTPALLTALAAGLGPVALNFGPNIATPLAYFIKYRSRIYASAIVTGSHLGAAQNGIKLQIGPNPPTPELLGRIRDYVQAHASDRHTAPAHMSTSVDPRGPALWASYKEHFIATFGRTGGATIALDCMNGCYAGRAREALTDAKFQVTALRDELLPDFGKATPDPSVEANLAQLRERVRAGGFNFGAALDGDGDRVCFVDETGRAVDNGTMLVLLTRYLLGGIRAAGRRGVIYDQKTRLAVVAALRQANASPVVERSGHSFMRTRMLMENAILGGETSGHYFWNVPAFYPVPAGDCGLFTVFAVADLLRRAGPTLSELAATVPASPFYTGDIRGLRYAGDRSALLQQIAESARAQNLTVDTTDGVRLERPGAFVHLRASVTESDMLTAACDATDAAGLTAMGGLVCDLLPPAAKAIGTAIRARVKALAV